MQLSKWQIGIIGVVLLIVVLAVLLFMGVIPGLRRNATGGAVGQLTVWGIFDDQDTVNKNLIAPFVIANPGVKINYVQMSPDTYEDDLVNALAAGTGPDVFMIKNTWLPKHSNKISPMPDSLLTVPALRLVFPDIIEKDFVTGGQIYALPLYLDTLALFYNKTIFNNAAIALPPTSWEDFKVLIPKLRQVDRTGRISQAAAAIGGSNTNINAATDLLTLIMMQQGVQMTDQKVTHASFSANGTPPVQFYTDFANARSENYTWDPSQHYSLDAFAEESAAMMFNYAFQIPLLKQKNPFLNFAVAPMLQIKGSTRQVNIANYLGFTVSNKSAQKNLAWQFIMNATLDQTTNINYLNATGRPPALRDIINLTLNDPETGVFSRQALTAQSWAKIDDAAVDASFTKMIDLIINGQLPVGVALKQAEEEVTAMIQRHLR